MYTNRYFKRKKVKRKKRSISGPKRVVLRIGFFVLSGIFTLIAWYYVTELTPEFIFLADYINAKKPLDATGKIFAVVLALNGLVVYGFARAAEWSWQQVKALHATRLESCLSG